MCILCIFVLCAFDFEAVAEMLKTKNIDAVAVDNAAKLMNQPELSKITKHAFLLNKAVFHLNKNEVTHQYLF